MNAAWLPTHTWSHLARLNLTAPWSTRLLPSTLRPAKSFFNSSLYGKEHPTLTEMRNRPYPMTGWDTSLFEDPGLEEFEAIQKRHSTGHSDSPCRILAKAVEEGNFVEAHTIRAELGEIGVQIQPNAIYERMAVEAAFSRPDKHGDVAAFQFWWSLVPQPPEDHPIRHASTLQPRILELCPAKGTYDTTLMALHVTYRGYSDVAFKLFVPQIVANAPLRFVTALLKDLCAAIEASLSAQLSDEMLVKSTREQHSRFYGEVIQLLVHARRGIDAAKLLLSADKLGVQISHKSFQVVAAALKDSQANHIRKEVLSVAHKQGTLVKTEPLDYSVNDTRTLYLISTWMVGLLEKGRFPPMKALQNLIAYCYSSGNYSTMETVRKAYFAQSREQAAITLWARAEILYFLSKGQKHAVLAAFFTYFQGIGTPRPDVISKILDHFHRRKQKDRRGGNPEEAVLARNRSDVRHEIFVPVHLRSTAPARTRKLEPTRFLNIFVWQALIGMCTHETLPSLYAELLRVAEEAKSKRLVSSTESVHAGQTPELFDAVHFNLFIHHLCRHRLYEEARAVLGDMKRVHVTPDLETYTTLLSGLKGNLVLTMEILQKFGQQFNLHTSSRSRPLHVRQGVRGIARTRGDINVTSIQLVYTSALQKALENGHLDCAAWIYRKLEKIRDMTPQTNHIVDSTMSDFRKAWRKNGRPGWLYKRMKKDLPGSKGAETHQTASTPLENREV